MNPVICEVTRGSQVESVHRGSYVVVDADGAIVASAGEVTRPVYERSALKLLQALPLVESGAADAAGFGPRHLALACASNSGEPGHVAVCSEMLARIGCHEDDLECGPQWPADPRVAAEAIAERGGPCRIHNNCCGKHAGFLALARHLGAPTAHYVGPDHPVQREVRATVAAMTRTALDATCCGVDGCSAPTFAVPLLNFARAYAQIGTGIGLEPARAAAGRRLLDAAMAEHWLVAGTGRCCTHLMGLAPGHLFTKTGAEGCYVAVLPDEGLAIALKCDDGATRAAEALVAALVRRHGNFAADIAADLEERADRPVTDFNGREVGRQRAVLAA